MAIRCCPACGSTDLNMPKFEDGVVPEIDNLNDYVCGACGIRANPFEFDKQSDYDAFVEHLE